jgi:hypothetical protein
MNRNGLVCAMVLVASNVLGMDRVLGFVTCGYYQKKSAIVSIRRNPSSAVETEITFRPIAANDSFRDGQSCDFEIQGKDAVNFSVSQGNQSHSFPLNLTAIKQIAPVFKAEGDLFFSSRVLKSKQKEESLPFIYKLNADSVKKGYAVSQAFLQRAAGKLEDRISFEKRESVKDVNVTVQKSDHIFLPDIVVSRSNDKINLPLINFMEIHKANVFDHMDVQCKLAENSVATVSLEHAKEVIDSLSFLQRFCLKAHSVRYQLMTVGLVASCLLMYKKFIQSAE